MMVTKFDLLLRGQKGLAALKHLTHFVDYVNRIHIRIEKGTLLDVSPLIIKLAEANNIEFTIHSNDSLVGGESNELNALAVGWDLMIKPFYNNIFVIHDSLLPKLRGWNPLVTSLILGDRHTGVTLFIADTVGFDRGPVLSQIKIPLKEFSYIGDALKLICDQIGELALKAITNGINLKKHAKMQDESKATLSLWRDELDYRINWMLNSEQIVRQIRALSSPYLGASSVINNVRVRILKAELEESFVKIELPSPGKIISRNHTGILVTTGSGVIRINEIVEQDTRQPLIINNLRNRFV